MRNTVFWSWNDSISEIGIIEQLNDFAKHGIEGVFVHARDGLNIDYLGERWMDLFELTVLQAKALKMDVWIYDEMGWPSGEANGKIVRLGNEYKAKKLKYAQTYDSSFQKQLIACYRKTEDDYNLVSFCEDADLYIYYELTEESDKMYEKTSEKFLELCHEQYKKRFHQYFGKEIKGVFFDESSINLFWPTLEYAWSLSLPAKFHELHGYNIKSKLWKLFFERNEYNIFLNDYLEATTELFFENFIQKIQCWCKENNLLLTGHFCMEETLHTSYRISGSVMRAYQMLDVPGIDLLGRRITSPVLYKQLSSVLRQFDKKDALCELFGAAGWDADCNQLLWVWKQNALNGVTIPCLHLASYSMRGQRKYDHPGFYSSQQPWWDCSVSFFDKMKEYGSFFENGIFHNDVLVVSPLLSLGGLEYHGCESQSISNNFRLLLEELSDMQIPYDIGDEILMRDYARVEDNKLIVGKCTYSIVIIPKCVSIKESTLSLLQQFTDNGGKLIFIEQYPKLVNFRENKTLHQYQSIWSKGENGLISFAKKRVLTKAFQYYHYSLSASVCDKYDGHISSEVEVAYCDIEDERRIMIFNKSTDSFKTVRLNIRDFYSLTEWKKGKLPVVFNEEGLTVSIQLAPTECRMFSANKTKEVVDSQRYLECTQFNLTPKSISKNLLNMLVLDMATTVVDGENRPLEYTGKLGFVKYEKTITVEYNFTIEDISKEIYVLCESADCTQLIINGHSIKEKGSGSLIDSSLVMYDITSLQREGINSIILTYDERVGNQVFVSPVMVYGRFDVKAEMIAEYATYYKTKSSFTICSEKNGLKNEEIVKQNLWFYQGPITYSYNLAYQGGRILLSFDDVACMALKIFVNGQEVCSMVEFYDEIDISNYLNIGDNAVDVIIYAGLRNVFGPHHHSVGVPNAVGYESFFGKLSFADMIWYKYLDASNIYTPEYHFRKVSLGDMIVKSIKERLI